MTDFVINPLLPFFLLAAQHAQCQNALSDLDTLGKHTLGRACSKQDLPLCHLATEGGEGKIKTETPACISLILPVILLVQGKEYSSRDFRTSGKSRAVGPPRVLQLDMSCPGTVPAGLREGQVPGHQRYTPLSRVL